MKLYASIYIGSYGISMKIFQIGRGQAPKELDSPFRPIPIVHEISHQGRISMETTDLIIKVLTEMKETIDGYHIKDYRVVAGASLDHAQNLLFLFEQIRLRTGLTVQLLTNSEQRFLEYEAVAAMDVFPDLLKDDCVMVDFGGASIQMTLFHEGSIRTTQHLSLGTFTLRETNRRLLNMPDHQEQLRDMIDKEFDAYQKMFLRDMDVKTIILVGDQDFVRPLVSALNLSGDQVIPTEKIRKAMKKDRKFRLDEGAAFSEDLNDPILLVHRELLKFIPAERIVVPKGNINNGMAVSYAYEKKLLKETHDFHQDILSASWAIADRYGSYRPHLEALHSLSLQIFDVMKKYHGLGKRERVLCEVCAILHDCGKYISIYESAQCSHRIILSSEILGLTHKEREIIAAVAKYNRLNLPPYEDLATDFTQDQYWTMVKLLAILKVANALDRSHKQKMKKASMRIRDKELIIGVQSNDSLALERGMFQNKADFFEQVFAIRPVIRQRG